MINNDINTSNTSSPIGIIVGQYIEPSSETALDASSIGDKEGLQGCSTLDWVLFSLRKAGVKEVFIISPDNRSIELTYKNEGVKFVRAEKTELLDKLLTLIKSFEAPVFVVNSDIIIRGELCSKLAKQSADVVVGIYTQWRSLYKGLPHIEKTKAKKVVISDNLICRIGSLIDDISCDAEFTGLVYFSASGIKTLKEVWENVRQRHTAMPFHDALNIKEARVTDLIQEMILAGVTVHPMEVSNEWAKIRNSNDIAKFVFGTKAETLERLHSVLSCAEVMDLTRFAVRHWKDDKKLILDVIKKLFSGQKVVVRSSSLKEDSWTESMAGAFNSVLDVSVDNREEFSQAVERVIGSYQRYDAGEAAAEDNHQVLVQSFLEDVAISGVVFTRDLHTGAPYFIINYDDQTGKTDSVTSGRSHNLKVLKVYRKKKIDLENPSFQKLILACSELEHITGCDSLDIEFAITSDGAVHIFQVRPMAVAAKWPETDYSKLSHGIDNLHRFLKKRLKPSISRTIFADMTDWNPAEIISTTPSVLAFSLYEYLVTDSTWRRSRASMGYHSLSGEILMVNLCGKPYIDVRNSYRSFVPAGVPHDLKERLVDHWLDLLESHPEYHDKVEFEIVPTCMTFDFEEEDKRLKLGGFNSDEVELLRKNLLELTDEMITQRSISIAGEMEKVHSLWDYQSLKDNELSGLLRIKCLLDSCREYGVLPFSNIARCAFVAKAILNSLIKRSVLTSDDVNNISRSIRTIATDIVVDIMRVHKGELTREEFLKTNGHLRPGTYDITSPRYDEEPELYLGVQKSSCEFDFENTEFILSSVQKEQISILLKTSGFTATTEQLMAFIVETIRGRENAKFAFTHSLSDALKLLKLYGESRGISAEDMACVNIHDILRLATHCISDDFSDCIIKNIAEGKKHSEVARSIHLPHIIIKKEDVQVVEHLESRPNFVTQKKIISQTVQLNSDNDVQIENKIVFIESADPGFDWVFSRNIAGLITMFGGANSHMAIRCAEFSIPAAIGCGAVLYETLSSAPTIELDCSGGIIRAGGITCA